MSSYKTSAALYTGPPIFLFINFSKKQSKAAVVWGIGKKPQRRDLPVRLKY